LWNTISLCSIYAVRINFVVVDLASVPRAMARLPEIDSTQQHSQFFMRQYDFDFSRLRLGPAKSAAR